ncbi:MAG: ferritin-like domain-containing protein [Methanomicrobiales archaeon]
MKPPDDPFIVKGLEQNLKGEQCAIKTCNNLLKKTRDADPVTYNIVLGILQMEVEHKADLTVKVTGITRSPEG